MKVLIARTPTHIENVIPELEAEFPGTEFVHCSSREEMMDMVADVDIYVGSLNREIFLAAKNLKWIQSTSTGINAYMGIPELVESNVLLTNVRGTHSVCVAESALAMILAYTRGIWDCMRSRPQRKWSGRNIRPKLVELTGSTMGIIGFGSVGRALAKLAQAFDMRIVAADVYPENKPEHVAELWELDRLGDLLRESDYVVVTVPYTPQTDNMIGAEQLAAMKPSAMLVLISRGGIVDQEALAVALREKRLAAAATDVAIPEPLPEDSELWDLENLLITYHVAGGTQYEGKYTLDIFRENMHRFLRGELPLRNQIDKQQGF